jgi:hypothetical protein
VVSRGCNDIRTARSADPLTAFRRKPAKVRFQDDGLNQD